MKILFVCRSNTGRSQVAEELYNELSGTDHATSAGVDAESRARTVGEIPAAKTVLQVMNQRGIDMSSNVRTQITVDLVKSVDKVIVMADPEETPLWLKDSEKYEYWPIDDIYMKNEAESKVIVAEIESRIKKLIDSTS